MTPVAQQLEELAREKRANRTANEEALASGEKTREQVWRENAWIQPEWVARARIDYSKMKF